MLVIFFVFFLIQQEEASAKQTLFLSEKFWPEYQNATVIYSIFKKLEHIIHGIYSTTKNNSKH